MPRSTSASSRPRARQPRAVCAARRRPSAAGSRLVVLAQRSARFEGHQRADTLPRRRAKTIAPRTTVTHANAFSATVSGGTHGDFISIVSAQ